LFLFFPLVVNVDVVVDDAVVVVAVDVVVLLSGAIHTWNQRSGHFL
jgi:hypothetical protein